MRRGGKQVKVICKFVHVNGTDELLNTTFCNACRGGNGTPKMTISELAYAARHDTDVSNTQCLRARMEKQIFVHDTALQNPVAEATGKRCDNYFSARGVLSGEVAPSLVVAVAVTFATVIPSGIVSWSVKSPTPWLFTGTIS